MKKLIQKDKKVRSSVLKYENKRLILKNIIKTKDFYSTLKWNAVLKLSDLSKKSSKVKISNRCIITGRKKSMINFFKFSRISFLKYSRLGKIYGVKKSTF